MINPMKLNDSCTCFYCKGKDLLLFTVEQTSISLKNGEPDILIESVIADEYIACNDCDETMQVYNRDGKTYPYSPLKLKLGLPPYDKNEPKYKFNNPFYKEGI